MADFRNLIGEIDNTQDLDDSNNEPRLDQLDDEGYVGQQAEIPAALLEAEAKRREEQERDRSEIVMDNEQELGGLEEGSQLSLDKEYESLKRMWIQEVNATELLKYDDMIPVLKEFIGEQESVIDAFKEQATQNSTSSAGDIDAGLASLAASICKLDMDRMAFLLSDLSRIRLEKIEKYLFHYLGDSQDHLGDNELDYLSQYKKLYESHMRRSVLDQIPKDAWKKLDEPDMIDRPDLGAYVFCKIIDEDGVWIDNHKGIDVDQDEEQNGEEHERHYDHGTVLFARYGAIRDFVMEGKIDLLM